MSPPALTWWYCVAIGVDARVAISTGFCGSVNRSSPRSLSGLKTTISTPRLAQLRKGWRQRGLFDPGFWPK